MRFLHTILDNQTPNAHQSNKTTQAQTLRVYQMESGFTAHFNFNMLEEV